jgi:LuxR family transcriptional regulator, maltose regulon positive regulatory protein
MSPAAAISRHVPARLKVLQGAPCRGTFGRGLVERARLMRRLMDARDLPLVLLTAPAGYGKTTTLLEWARHDERPFAWVALDRAEDDPAHLLASVVRSTGALGPRGSASVLVLDDAQELRSPAALEALTSLLDRPPAGCQIVVASRREPPLPLGRLRANREVLELTARDFVMTHREAGELLDRAGVALDAAEVDALVERTEGWPAGLYLAALSLRDQGDAAAAIVSFGGDDRLVADYVADALLADLSDEDVRFLLRTSVLDRLSGPLCDAVLREHGAAARLRKLARANVLLVALDRIDRWYRYHGMLAQALRAELRRREPELEPELHRRASRWHAEHDEIDAAIRHAAAAHDVELAGDLLWANVLGYVAAGREAPVWRWLEHFSEQETASFPPLALVAANAHLARGERELAEHWTAAAVDALHSSAPRGPMASVEAGIATMRGAIARDGVVRMRDDAARAYELATDDSPWRSLDCQLEGTACHLLGDRERAGGLLREGARRGLVAAPSVSALCLAQLALLARESVDRHDGLELAARARAQIERFRLGDQPTMSLVFAVSALSRAQLGKVDAATGDAAAAIRLLERLVDGAPWFRAEVGIVLACALLALSDVVGARALLDGAACELRAAPDAAVLVTWLAEAREQVDIYSTGAAAPVSLSTAELRILRLLPTHLSFAEMGSQLYVSINTVKSQAQAVYRKLDASSRSEAVVRARDVGLLDDPIAV